MKATVTDDDSNFSDSFGGSRESVSHIWTDGSSSANHRFNSLAEVALSSNWC
jgi:hypothetical protein